MRKISGTILGVTMLALGAMAPAHSAVAAGVALPGDVTEGWRDATIVVPAGTEVTFVNLDVVGPGAHDITAKQKKANGAPLFKSETIPAGEVAPVVGTASLAPGSYQFICSVHPATMDNGVLIVR